MKKQHNVDLLTINGAEIEDVVQLLNKSLTQCQYSSLVWIYYSVVLVSSTFLGQSVVAICLENAATKKQNGIRLKIIKWIQARQERQLDACVNTHSHTYGRD